MGDRYNIVRFYQDSSKSRRIIERNVTLEQAQAHCNDPQSSSKTCTTKAGRAVTQRNGPWFDGYDKA